MVDAGGTTTYRVALIPREQIRPGDVLYSADKVVLRTEQVPAGLHVLLGDLGAGGGVKVNDDPHWWAVIEGRQEWVYLAETDPRLDSAEQVKPGLRSERAVMPWLTTADVAAMLGISPASVRRYVARGDMPRPDGHFSRTPWWRAETVLAWRDGRPGRGAGGGRRAKRDTA